MKYLVLIFLFSHLMSDYILYSKRHLRYVKKTVRDVCVHASVHLVLSLALGFYFFRMNGIYVGALIGLLHLLIDLLSLRTASKSSKSPLLYHSIDQILHFASIFLISASFAETALVAAVDMRIFVVLCGWISATFIITLVAKQILFDSGVLDAASGDHFFIPGERISDGIYLTSIFLLSFAGFSQTSPILIALGLGCLFFLGTQNKKMHPDPRFYAIKLGVYSIWSAINCGISLFFYHYFS